MHRNLRRFLPGTLLPALLLGALLSAVAPTAAHAQPSDEMSLERWKLLREVERHQLQIAEKYFRAKEWKIALAEYEKYLTLYEASEAASYAQLKWSICQAQLRNQNTAIREGYQSVIDYWPDSPEAISAAYYIGQTYKGMGRLAEAKGAYRQFLEDHGEHVIAAQALADLVEIASIEKDGEATLALRKQLTFDVERTKATERLCIEASHNLARHYFYRNAFGEAVQALATTYQDEKLTGQVVHYAGEAIAGLLQKEQTKADAEALASATIQYVQQQAAQLARDGQPAAANRHALWVIAIHSRAGHDEKIPELYEALLKTDGSDEMLGRLANWYRSRNRWDEAREVYRRMANKIEGLSQIASSYRHEQQRDKAVATYQELVTLDADRALHWKAEIAQTYREGRQWAEALKMYDELAVQDTARADHWRWQIATAYEEQGKHKEAIGHYRQCTNFPRNYQQMAGCYRKLGEHNEAILLYNQIAASHPGIAPWAMIQIGYTYEQAQQKEKAIKAFQVVCKRFPNDGHASQAHAHLQTKYKITVTLGGSTSE